MNSIGHIDDVLRVGVVALADRLPAVVKDFRMSTPNQDIHAVDNGLEWP